MHVLLLLFSAFCASAQQHDTGDQINFERRMNELRMEQLRRQNTEVEKNLAERRQAEYLRSRFRDLINDFSKAMNEFAEAYLKSGENVFPDRKAASAGAAWERLVRFEPRFRKEDPCPKTED